MEREQALRMLGLTDAPDPLQLREHYDARREILATRLASAQTDGLREKYTTALGELVAAYEILKENPTAPGFGGLSKTQIGDLPGAGPSYTRGVATLSPSAAMAPGEILLDRYEIRQLIGEGGMGSVYRAYDRTRDEEVALKVLLPALVASEQARERFLSEAKISSRLSHPNIVNVFNVERAGDRYFLTMELLRGQTLRQLLQRPTIGQSFGSRGSSATLSVDQALEIAGAIGAALTYAHRFTVHRDVKPENIWVEETGGYKLMDFGIARLLTGSQLTKTAMAIGSAYYMAPEQLKDSKNVDGRADQYSLAVVLYEAICGEVPAGRVKSLSDRVRGVPRAFSMAIDRALEPQAESRFPDIDSFIKALNVRGIQFQGNRALQYAIGGAIAVALLAGLLLSWPHVKGMLPDSSVAERTKTEAIESQAALTELMRRIETLQREIDEEARDARATVERLRDRTGTARDEGEQKVLSQQRADAAAAADTASAVRDIADSKIFSVDVLSKLKGQIAVGETELRDGHVVDAAQVLARARDSATQLIAAAESLKPALGSKQPFDALLERAAGVIDQNGGNSGILLADVRSAGSRASYDLSQGKPTEAVEEWKTASADTRTVVHEFFGQLVKSYGVIAQKKMAVNDLITAEAAIAKAKQMTQLQSDFQ